MRTILTSTALLMALACVAGCSGVARLVSARVEIRSGTNVVTLVQPKDTTLRRLEYDPHTGALVLQGYASAANPAAIEAARAQAEAQRQAFDRAAAMMEWAMQAAARSQGVTLADPPSATGAPRSVRRWKLVPVDDPSQGPHPEVLVVPE